MDETKVWYASKTMWATVIQTVLSVAVVMGFISTSGAAVLLGVLPDTIVGIVGILFGLYTAYGRVVATAKID